MLSPDYSQRGYLLPPGCKDLIDVLKLQAPAAPRPPGAPPDEPPPLTGEILISEPASAGDLARLLGEKPFKIIADLMQLGVFASVSQPLTFEITCQLARKYGYQAKRRT